MITSISIILALATLFAYVNYRWLKLPPTISLMIMALVTALTLIALEPFFPFLYSFFCQTLMDIEVIIAQV
jgi:CPA1 family monovalent cation:H+ antiporter